MLNKLLGKSSEQSNRRANPSSSASSSRRRAEATSSSRKPERSSRPSEGSSSVASTYATAPTAADGDGTINRREAESRSGIGNGSTNINPIAGRRRSEDRHSERRRDRSSDRDRRHRHDHRSRSRERGNGKRKERRERRVREEESGEGEHTRHGGGAKGNTFGGNEQPRGGDENVISSVPETQRHDPQALSAHVSAQFPGQNPAQFTAPFRPKMSVNEGGPGLAAEYYGDQGQSVAQQPGVRPQPPSVIVGAEPHLMPASAHPAPPAETGSGSAQDYFASGGAPQPNLASGSGVNANRPSKLPTMAAAGGGAVLGYALGNGSDVPQHGSPSASAGTVGVSHSSSAPAVPTLGSSGLPINRPPKKGEQPQGSSSNLPLYAAGAAGLAAGAYALNQKPTSTSGSLPPPYNGKIEHVDGDPSQMPGLAITKQQQPIGPLQKLVDWWKDHEDVQKMEEYTEYIGVCKNCFDPRSTSAEAPRKHHYHRRRSSETHRSRVDKETRYLSSDSERKRRGSSSWIASGIAAYGLGKIGKSLWKQNRDFDDTYSVRSGRYRDSRTSVSGRAGRIARDRNNNVIGLVEQRKSKLKDRKYAAATENERKHASISSDSQFDSSQGQPGNAKIGVAVGTLAAAELGTKYGSKALHSARKKKPSDQNPGGASVFELADSSSRRASQRLDGSSTSLSSAASQTRRPKEGFAPGKVQSSDISKKHGGKSKERKRRKQKSFFSFGGASSSESDLAYGTGSASHRYSKSASSDDGLDHTLTGLSATAAAIAAVDSRRQKRRKGGPEVVAVRETRHIPARQVKSSLQYDPRHSKSENEDEEGWESVSERDDASSLSSGLAFGDFSYGTNFSGRKSQESVSSATSGTGKWKWRWGSKRKKHISEPDSSKSTASNAPGLAVGGPLPIGNEVALSDGIGMIPVRPVYPVPTDDPNTFDAISHPPSTSSMQAGQVSFSSRFDHSPLQPQPVRHVSKVLYDAEAHYQPSHLASRDTPGFAAFAHSQPSQASNSGSQAVNGSRRLSHSQTFPVSVQGSGTTSSTQFTESRPLPRRISAPLPSAVSQEAGAAKIAYDRAAKDPIAATSTRKKRRDSRSTGETHYKRRSTEVEAEHRSESNGQDGLEPTPSRWKRPGSSIAKGKPRSPERQMHVGREVKSEDENDNETWDEQVQESPIRLNLGRGGEESREDVGRRSQEPQAVDRVLKKPKTNEGIKVEFDTLGRDASFVQVYQTGKTLGPEEDNRHKAKGIEDVEDVVPLQEQREADIDREIEERRQTLEKREREADWPHASAAPVTAAVADAAAAAVLAGNGTLVGITDDGSKELLDEQPANSSDNLSNAINDPDYFKKRDSKRQREAKVMSARDVVTDLLKRYQEEPQSMADFFAPPELSDRTGGGSSKAEADAAIDIFTRPIPNVVTIEPSMPGLSDNQLYTTKTDNSLPSLSTPWPVPFLNLIEPTPPTSIAGSVRGMSSGPPSPAKPGEPMAENLEDEDSSHRRSPSKVMWAEPETRVYEVPTPDSVLEEYVSPENVTKGGQSHPGGRATHVDEMPRPTATVDILVEETPQSRPLDSKSPEPDRSLVAIDQPLSSEPEKEQSADQTYRDSDKESRGNLDMDGNEESSEIFESSMPGGFISEETLVGSEKVTDTDNRPHFERDGDGEPYSVIDSEVTRLSKKERKKREKKSKRQGRGEALAVAPEALTTSLENVDEPAPVRSSTSRKAKVDLRAEHLSLKEAEISEALTDKGAARSDDEAENDPQGIRAQSQIAYDSARTEDKHASSHAESSVGYELKKTFGLPLTFASAASVVTAGIADSKRNQSNAAKGEQNEENVPDLSTADTDGQLSLLSDANGSPPVKDSEKTKPTLAESVQDERYSASQYTGTTFELENNEHALHQLRDPDHDSSLGENSHSVQSSDTLGQQSGQNSTQQFATAPNMSEATPVLSSSTASGADNGKVKVKKGGRLSRSNGNSLEDSLDLESPKGEEQSGRAVIAGMGTKKKGKKKSKRKTYSFDPDDENDIVRSPNKMLEGEKEEVQEGSEGMDAHRPTTEVQSPLQFRVREPRNADFAELQPNTVSSPVIKDILESENVPVPFLGQRAAQEPPLPETQAVNSLVNFNVPNFSAHDAAVLPVPRSRAQSPTTTDVDGAETLHGTAENSSGRSDKEGALPGGNVLKSIDLPPLPPSTPGSPVTVEAAGITEELFQQPVAEQDVFDVTKLPPLPTSRPDSPYDDPPEAVTPPPLLSSRKSSSTSIPLRFRRPPPSPGVSRDFVFGSPGTVSPGSLSPVRGRTRHFKSQSAEFRSSKEFRPLYLVERNLKSIDVEEILPELPPSRETSPESCSHDPADHRRDDLEGSQQNLHASASQPPDLRQGPADQSDYFGSQPSNPHDKMPMSGLIGDIKGRQSEEVTIRHPVESPIRDLQTAPSQNGQLFMDSDRAKSPDRSEQKEECDSSRALFGLSNLPPLPASRPSSPYEVEVPQDKDSTPADPRWEESHAGSYAIQARDAWQTAASGHVQDELREEELRNGIKDVSPLSWKPAKGGKRGKNGKKTKKAGNSDENSPLQPSPNISEPTERALKSKDTSPSALPPGSSGSAEKIEGEETTSKQLPDENSLARSDSVDLDSAKAGHIEDNIVVVPETRDQPGTSFALEGTENAQGGSVRQGSHSKRESRKAKKGQKKRSSILAPETPESLVQDGATVTQGDIKAEAIRTSSPQPTAEIISQIEYDQNRSEQEGIDPVSVVTHDDSGNQAVGHHSEPGSPTALPPTNDQDKQLTESSVDTRKPQQLPTLPGNIDFRGLSNSTIVVNEAELAPPEMFPLPEEDSEEASFLHEQHSQFAEETRSEKSTSSVHRLEETSLCVGQLSDPIVLDIPAEMVALPQQSLDEVNDLSEQPHSPKDRLFPNEREPLPEKEPEKVHLLTPQSSHLDEAEIPSNMVPLPEETQEEAAFLSEQLYSGEQKTFGAQVDNSLARTVDGSSSGSTKNYVAADRADALVDGSSAHPHFLDLARPETLGETAGAWQSEEAETNKRKSSKRGKKKLKSSRNARDLESGKQETLATAREVGVEEGQAVVSLDSDHAVTSLQVDTPAKPQPVSDLEDSMADLTKSKLPLTEPVEGSKTTTPEVALEGLTTAAGTLVPSAELKMTESEEQSNVKPTELGRAVEARVDGPPVVAIAERLEITPSVADDPTETLASPFGDDTQPGSSNFQQPAASAIDPEANDASDVWPLRSKKSKSGKKGKRKGENFRPQEEFVKKPATEADSSHVAQAANGDNDLASAEIADIAVQSMALRNAGAADEQALERIDEGQLTVGSTETNLEHLGKQVVVAPEETPPEGQTSASLITDELSAIEGSLSVPKQGAENMATTIVSEHTASNQDEEILRSTRSLGPLVTDMEETFPKKISRKGKKKGKNEKAIALMFKHIDGPNAFSTGELGSDLTEGLMSADKPEATPPNVASTSASDPTEGFQFRKGKKSKKGNRNVLEEYPADQTAGIDGVPQSGKTVTKSEQLEVIAQHEPEQDTPIIQQPRLPRDLSQPGSHGGPVSSEFADTAKSFEADLTSEPKTDNVAMEVHSSAETLEATNLTEGDPSVPSGPNFQDLEPVLELAITTPLPNDTSPTSEAEDRFEIAQRDVESIYVKLNADESPVAGNTSESKVPDTKDHVPSPPQDLEFAATLAAGLEDSGFDPELVVQNLNFHSTSSSPRSILEADGDEVQVLKRRPRNNKKGKSKANNQSEPTKNVIGVSQETSHPDLSENHEHREEKSAFEADILTGLERAGFDPSMVNTSPRSGGQSPEITAPDDEQPIMVTRKSKKAKKTKTTRKGPLKSQTKIGKQGQYSEQPDDTRHADFDESQITIVGSQEEVSTGNPDAEALSLTGIEAELSVTSVPEEILSVDFPGSRDNQDLQLGEQFSRPTTAVVNEGNNGAADASSLAESKDPGNLFQLDNVNANAGEEMADADDERVEGLQLPKVAEDESLKVSEAAVVLDKEDTNVNNGGAERVPVDEPDSPSEGQRTETAATSSVEVGQSTKGDDRDMPQGPGRLASIFPGLERVKRRKPSLQQDPKPPKAPEPEAHHVQDSKEGSEDKRPLMGPLLAEMNAPPSPYTERLSTAEQGVRHPITVPPPTWEFPPAPDSAVQVSSTLPVPQEYLVNDSVRDSGFQDASSTTEGLVEWPHTAGSDALGPSASENPVSLNTEGSHTDTKMATELEHSPPSTPPPAERTLVSPLGQVNVPVEVSPEWDLSPAREPVSASVISTSSRLASPEAEITEKDDELEEQVPSAEAETTRGLTFPSPVESTTKERASHLFHSSPSTRGMGDGNDTGLHSSIGNAEGVPDTPTNSTRFGRKRKVDGFGQEVNESQSIFGGDNVNVVSPTVTDHNDRSRDIPSPSKPDMNKADLSQPSPLGTRTVTDNGRSSKTSEDAVFESSAIQQPKYPASNDKSPLSTDELIARLSWPAVDEDRETVGLERGLTRSGQRSLREETQRPASATSDGSDKSKGKLRKAEHFRPLSASGSRSSTPPLRRTDRSVSGDLRAASRLGEGGARAAKKVPIQEPGEPSTYDNEKDKGKSRAIDMTNIYEGWGDAPGSPKSPARPPSVRKRQSMHIVDLETRLNELVSENRQLQEAKAKAELGAEAALQQRGVREREIAEAVAARDLAIREKDAEVARISTMLESIRQEVARLNQVNQSLAESSRASAPDVDEEHYAALRAESAHAHQQWQETAQALDELREKHSELSAGMEEIVRDEVASALEERNSEIERLRDELETAMERIRSLQQQILASKQSDDFLIVRDEDYFDTACQQLCQHVQQWVVRFSKFSDARACRLSTEIADDKVEARLDNAILDGSDVDMLLADRVRRRDVFMSVVMTMVWEYVFTRYLFGMDREQRQVLKSLEKTLTEVGPARAVAQWRAVTLTLLSRRESFANQRAQDTEAVVQEIYDTLATLLPPPLHLQGQIQESLRNIMRLAVNLSIEMRTQRAEYIMLPPLQPEYDTNGDLVRKVHFNASLMNERSGETTSNAELEEQGAVVKMVLFPLVVKKGDDLGDGEDEIVVCPAQVLVAKPQANKKVVRVLSGAMEIDSGRNKSSASIAQESTLDMSNVI